MQSSLANLRTFKFLKIFDSISFCVIGMRTQGLVTGLVLLAVCDAWSGQVTLKIAVDLQGAVDDLDGKPRSAEK